MSLRASFLVAACAVVALAGCSKTETGSPQAVDGKTTEQSSSAPTAGKSTTKAAGSDLDPCTLLSASDLTTLGAKAGKPNSVAGRKTCSWAVSGAEGLLIGVGKSSLAELKGQSITIGKHEAAKLPSTEYRGCAVALGLPDASNVTVVASPPVGQPDETACPKAIDVAKIIDPKLP